MSAIHYNEGVRVQTAPVCFLCRTPGQALYTGLRDRLFGAPGSWNLLQCPACGLVWLNPRPIPEDLPKLYVTYYTHAPSEQTPSSYATLRKKLKWRVLANAFGYTELRGGPVRQIVGLVLSRIGPLRDKVGGTAMWLEAAERGRLLDVGCGDGRFLRQMQDLGWEATGVEPDPVAFRAATGGRKANVLLGTLEEAALPDSAFHVVTMNNVIEHLSDPIRTLRECYRVLRQDGSLTVVTPNIESLGRRWFGRAWLHWDPPRHLFLLSAKTLRQCLESVGFEIREARTTAREASGTWNISSVIGRDGVVPERDLESLSQRLGLVALSYWVAEHFLMKLAPWGEEIVMVARKKQQRDQSQSPRNNTAQAT